MNGILYSELSYAVVGAAMEVHKVLGSGFLEVVYQKALMHEFTVRGIVAIREQQIPVFYKDVDVGFYIADFVVDQKIILEIKAVAQLTNVHKAQAINYLTATGYKLAILINFGEKSLKTERLLRKT